MLARRSPIRPVPFATVRPLRFFLFFLHTSNGQPIHTVTETAERGNFAPSRRIRPATARTALKQQRQVALIAEAVWRIDPLNQSTIQRSRRSGLKWHLHVRHWVEQLWVKMAIPHALCFGQRGVPPGLAIPPYAAPQMRRETVYASRFQMTLAAVAIWRSFLRGSA